MTPTIARALALLAILTLGAVQAQERTVATYQGDGWRAAIGPFTVEDHWEVRWIADGPLFSLWYTKGVDRLAWSVDHAHQNVPGAGSTYVARGGTFEYQLTTHSPWEVEIVQLDPTTFPTLDRSGLTFSGVGTNTLRPFTVEGPWEITWEQTEENVLMREFMGIAVYGLADALAASKPPDSDVHMGFNASSFRTPRHEEPYGGTFYLKINTDGPWAIRIAALQ